MSFRDAKRRLGFLGISLAISTFTSFLEKICMRNARIIGQMSIKSWFREISESLRIRILTEKRTKIRSPGWHAYAFLITSAIFSNRPLILCAYLS